jgi:hypothetical protein
MHLQKQIKMRTYKTKTAVNYCLHYCLNYYFIFINPVGFF